jgi:hypothetical protein
MTETPIRLEAIPWRRLLPWLHLTRAFWIAVDLRKLVLAAAGLLLTSAGSLVFDQLPFGRAVLERSGVGNPEAERWPWQWSLGYRIAGSGNANDSRSNALSEFRGVLDHPAATLTTALGNWQIVLHPIRAISEPAARFFHGYATWTEIADSATRLLWMLIVWSIFGGAIARIAAVQFARDQMVGIREALGFVVQRFFGYLSAPLLALAGVGILWGLCVIGGWLGRIPGGVGEAILGILWGLELVFGLMMSVVLIGLAAGWPLMFATIGVEGTDGFDGLSRMYNYVIERPLYYIWQIALMLVYGSSSIFFVWLMVQLLVHLAVWGVSWGLGYEATVGLLAGSPETVIGGLRTFGDGTNAPASALGAQIARGWMCVLATLVMGFVHSYFWTAATIIYFTLRKSVDANEFDEVYVEGAPEEDELLPLVGAAAMGEAGRDAAPSGTAPQPPAQPNDAPPVELAP